MKNTIRTFVAIPLPESIITFIRKLQDGIRDYGFKARWVRPENIHLTLKFLGDIDKSDTEKIGDAMSDTVKVHPPLSLAAKGIGVFPGIKRPRVIWMGLKGDTFPLIELQKTLDRNLHEVGFPKESRPFKGHLTLTRIKGHIDSRKLLDAMESFGNLESETFAADQIVLFKSDLKPTGAVYTRLICEELICQK